MAYTVEQIRVVYDKTSGRCHICRKRISIKNYGVHGARGAWHVDHSRARARGGADHGNNYLPACIPCNLDKSDGSTRAARARAGHGKTMAPLSKEKREAARTRNAVVGGLGGAALGGAIAGPPGAAIGGALGALLGGSSDPEE